MRKRDYCKRESRKKDAQTVFRKSLSINNRGIIQRLTAQFRYPIWVTEVGWCECPSGRACIATKGKQSWQHRFYSGVHSMKLGKIQYFPWTKGTVETVSSMQYASSPPLPLLAPVDENYRQKLKKHTQYTLYAIYDKYSMYHLNIGPQDAKRNKRPF